MAPSSVRKIGRFRRKMLPCSNCEHQLIAVELRNKWLHLPLNPSFFVCKPFWTGINSYMSSKKVVIFASAQYNDLKYFSAWKRKAKKGV